MQNWLYSGASVIGQSHITAQIPCQDKFSCKVTEDGRWLSVAVSDGAGSALNAEAGAEITSTIFCEKLLGLSTQLDKRPPGEWINDFVVECVLNVRNELRAKAKSDDIKSFHCTLVAALVGPEGGFSIHIGDGSIFGGQFKDNFKRGEVELNSNFVISKPENGEYTNETYFITEGNWIKHLRVTPLPRLDWVVACTDGGAALILEKEIEVKPKFLVPFFKELIGGKFSNKNYISDVLSDPKANSLTTDDKTIFVAMRSTALQLSHLNFTIADSLNLVPPNDSTQIDQVQVNQPKDSLILKKNSAKSIILFKTKIIILIGLLSLFLIIIFTVKWFESGVEIVDSKSNGKVQGEVIKKPDVTEKVESKEKSENDKKENKINEKETEAIVIEQTTKEVVDHEKKLPEIITKKPTEEVSKNNKSEEQSITNIAIEFFNKIYGQLRKIIN